MGVLQMRQSLSSDAGGVVNTFSSWDNCMSKAYCKWPVIIAIIIASLIVASVVFCIARCLCCGAECCCACFSCCNACCPSPRRRGPREPKYQDPPQNRFQPSPYQGYQPTPAPPVYNAGPQFAQFDAPSGHTGGSDDDALPAMPSWDTASTRKVLDENQREDPEDVELNHLDPVTAHDATASLASNQAVAPSRSGYGQLAQNPPSPISPSPYSSSPYAGGDLGTQNPYHQQSYGVVGVAGVPQARPHGPQAYPQQSYGVRGGAPQRRQQQQQQQQSYNAPQPQQSYSNAYDSAHLPQRQSYTQQQQRPPQPFSAYGSSYASSESTRFEPYRHQGQESGTTFVGSQSPPPSLQAGAPSRRPVGDQWREV
ncbi:MAG: hypothetical protein MMC33_002238 [Icmadophila ericetorum]|nr:hypothetical protein [Icmadophila ericetorum]